MPQLQITTQDTTLLQLLESLTLHPQSQPTTLVICSSKPDFLARLTHALQPSTTTTPLSTDTNPRPKPHAFLTPTLHLLSTTQSITLIFCGSINSLRACMSRNNSSSNGTKLIVVDAVALHRETSEFTVQGLGRTFAAVAAAAGDVRVVECGDGVDDGGAGGGVALWDLQVPLLSASVRIAEPRVGASWVGRSVSVRRVVERWFRFDGE